MGRTTVTAGLILLLGLAGQAAGAGPYGLSYTGRLADAADHAVAGPVDLELKFFRTASGGSPVGVSPTTFAAVALTDGIFQVDFTQLTADELHLVFDGTDDAFVEVTDKTHGVTYPRQKMAAVPYALKVPVDGSSITYNSHGQLVANQPAAGATTISSTPVSAVAPAAGQILKYDGTQWSPAAAGGAGTVTNLTATAPLSVANGSTTPALSMTQASAASAGFLAAGDWVAFNAKQSQLGFSPLNKAGDAMTGTLGLGTFTNTQEAALGLVTPDAGKHWYNSTTGQIKYWNGSTAIALGAAGAGLSSLNGEVGSTQTFAVPGTTGTAPSWTHTTNIHTLNLPMASGAGVTAGLLSNTDWTSFTNGATAATSATSANTFSKIVARDASGNFAAATITANLTGNASGSAASFTGALAGDVTGTQGATTVAQVAGVLASVVGSGANAANNATNAGTASTIVKRDASGNFSANLITANLNGSANNVTGVVGVANGGTGSAGQNFVDLASNQAAISGTKTFTTQLIGKGTSIADSAASGFIGEVINNVLTTGSAVTLATGTTSNVTSISLTAGHWLVCGEVAFQLSGGTTVTKFQVGSSTTTGTLPSPSFESAPTGTGNLVKVVSQASSAPGGDVAVDLPCSTVKLGSMTTIFLVAQSTFTAGTNKAFGFIEATRMR